MLRGLVGQLLADHPDLTIVGEFRDDAAACAGLDETGVDVLIVCRASQEPDYSAQLSSRPQLRIVTLVPDAGGLSLHLQELGRRRSFGDADADTLLKAIRGGHEDQPESELSIPTEAR